MWFSGDNAKASKQVTACSGKDEVCRVEREFTMRNIKQNQFFSVRNQQIPIAAAGLGFTLIELVIVMAIVAMLTAVSYPSYIEHVKKGSRAQAQAFLMDVAQRQQGYLIVHRDYARSLSQLGFADSTGSLSVGSDLGSLADTYDVAGLNMNVLSGPPPSFNLTLLPHADSHQSDDGSLCLANSGARARHCGTDAEVSW